MEGGYTAYRERRPTELPHPVNNDQSLILLNFEGLVLLCPSEIKRELCKLLILINQGIDRYKVLVVGKNGKLNDTTEVSALWSIVCEIYTISHKRRFVSSVGILHYNIMYRHRA